MFVNFAIFEISTKRSTKLFFCLESIRKFKTDGRMLEQYFTTCFNKLVNTNRKSLIFSFSQCVIIIILADFIKDIYIFKNVWHTR